MLQKHERLLGFCWYHEKYAMRRVYWPWRVLGLDKIKSVSLTLQAEDSSESDETLVARIKTGDQRAFRALALRHGARYRALAYRFMADSAMAEDLVQEAFVKVWTNADSFDGERAKFTTWFHRVVVNRCLDEKRKRRLEPLPEGYDEPDTTAGADIQLEQGAVLARLQESLQGLSERQRVAVTLSYLDGLSNQEAADVMELNIKAYESLLVRARSKMRDTLVSDKADLIAAFG